MGTSSPFRRIALPFIAGILIGVLWVLVSGCSNHSEPSQAAAAPKAPDLRILAGSELKELEPDIKEAARKIGLDVEVSYSGTLDMVDRINAGESFDAILPPNGAYPVLALTRKPLAREKLFYSRVALGVKSSKARALGWDQRAPTWSDIVQAVKEHKLVYGMTNPTSSNTGMSALFAVASAIAKKTEDLSAEEVDRDKLTTFLSGQKLTAGSSGWLADAYIRDEARLDGLVNYEAVLLRLNEQSGLHEPLTLIYPRDGVISADYPLMLLSESKRPAYDHLVAALRSDAFQAGPIARMYLRPSNPNVTRAAKLSGDTDADARSQLDDQSSLLRDGAAGKTTIRLEIAGRDITGEIDLASDAAATTTTRGPAGKGFNRSLGISAADLERLCKDLVAEAVDASGVAR